MRLVILKFQKSLPIRLVKINLKGFEMKKLTQERLREVADYNPDTGIFTWKVSTGRRTKAGDTLGSKHYTGYTHAQVDNEYWGTHRLAFLYMTGKVPCEVDHIDRDKGNCRWSNLRACTRAENQANKGVQSNNTTGLIGVKKASRVTKQGQKYEASISKNNIHHHLGTFIDPLNAAITRDMEALRLYGEFAILNNYPGDVDANTTAPISEEVSTVKL